MKIPIRVYNKFLDLQGETDSYQSLQYKRSYHGVGDFELHINRYMHGADNFLKGNIIALNKQENKAGLILSREIELDENGKESENFKLTGITMDGIMNRRVSVPPKETAYDRKSGDAETVMKHYVYNHFVNPADKSRKLDMLEIAPNQNRGEHVSWESRFKVIGEELEKISIESSLGWGIFVDFNTKKLVFDCFQAKNLIQNNEFGYSPVFFSPEFETIKSQSFIDSDTDYKNVGYVGGQGEGVERKIIELGNTAGWDRIETFVDARDVGTEDDEDEEDLTDEEIEQLLIDRGKKKMKEMETVFSLEAEILTPITRKAYEYSHEGYLYPAQTTGRYVSKQQQITPFQYEKDFDLGDRVEVVNKSWGLTMTAPITEFLEVHEPGGFRLEGTFGQSRPTLITKIKDKFNELEGIEKQEAPASVAVGKMKEALKYTDDKLTEEERKRIEQAMENLEKSMKHAEDYTSDYTYDKDQIDKKDKDAIDSAAMDAKEKADAAQRAAENVADAKAKLAEENAIANADGKITAEEKKRIEQAEKNLSAAKAEAKAKADAAERAANAYSEEQDKKVKEDAAKDAKDKADEALENANDFSKDASNLMEGIIDVGSIPLRTAYSGARINFDGVNGFVVYDKDGNPIVWFDLNGNAKFSGDITGATGTFGDVNVKDGDFTLEDNISNVKYSVTPARNMIQDHSFEMMQPGEMGADSIEHNWTDIVKTIDDKWSITGNPKIVTQFAPEDAKALAIHGNRAMAVKDANFVRQYIYEGVGGGSKFTISGFFKRQWNQPPGKPRFEVDVIDASGGRTRLINEIFETVPTDYSVVRRSATFTVPSTFEIGGSLDVKLSGGDSNWVHCDGIQMVEYDKPTVYQPEDSIWEITKGKYKSINNLRTLWAGVVFLRSDHKIYPEKNIEECANGWLLQWSAYSIGSGAVESDFGYTVISKNTEFGRGHRGIFYKGGSGATFVHKFFYIDRDRIVGHDSNGTGDNRNICLRAVIEF